MPLTRQRQTLFCALGLLSIGTTFSRASLGETLDQCIARYGMEAASSGTSDSARIIGQGHTFQKDGFSFEEYILHGVVQCESITKTDNTLFSEKERQSILDFESTGAKWNGPFSIEGQEIWTRVDGAIMACFPLGATLIETMSKDYLLAVKAAKTHPTAFPMEAEVRNIIVVGLEEDEVRKRFGIPSSQRPGHGKDEKVLEYLELPSRTKMTFGYVGFEVFCQKGKVTDLQIIHATTQ
jgi:hypothetical protein